MRLALLLALAPAALSAQDLPRLTWPLACSPGEGCFLQNLVDRDPGPEARDVSCLGRTYDGHDGTDIALPTLADQAEGMEVRAVLPGTVAGLRNGMEDRLQTRDGTGPDVTDRECGNGVLLRHADGWESQYCHMANGSLTVAEGDEVEAGDPLGLVGLSGNTEFPHLHVTLRQDGRTIDPFDPDGDWTCGEDPAPALWTDPVPLPEGGFLDLAFASDVPEYGAITDGSVDLPAGRNTPLVLWAYFHGMREGDQLVLTIEGADGILFESDETQDSALARGFRAGGKRPPDGGWPAGRYRGTAILSRDGAEVDRSEVEIDLD